MPQMRYYVVTETREVEVTAVGPEEAIRVAMPALRDGDTTTKRAGVRSPVRTRQLSAKEG